MTLNSEYFHSFMLSNSAIVFFSLKTVLKAFILKKPQIPSSQPRRKENREERLWKCSSIRIQERYMCSILILSFRSFTLFYFQLTLKIMAKGERLQHRAETQ